MAPQATSANRNMVTFNLVTTEDIEGKSGENWVTTARKQPHDHQFDSSLAITDQIIQHQKITRKWCHWEMIGRNMFRDALTGNDINGMGGRQKPPIKMMNGKGKLNPAARAFIPASSGNIASGEKAQHMMSGRQMGSGTLIDNDAKGVRWHKLPTN